MRARASRPVLAALAAALLLAASPAHAAAAQENQVPSGLAVLADFSFSSFNLLANSDVTRTFGIEGGLFAGYKLDRLIIGLGFDLQRVALSTVTTGANASEASADSTVIGIAPGLSYALLRSDDKRVELFAAAEIGWLHYMTGATGTLAMPAGKRSTEGLFYRVGPGLRYFLHPSFALQLLPSLRGQFRWDTASATDGSQRVSQSLSVTTIDVTLGFLAVF